MPRAISHPRWGVPPWSLDFEPAKSAFPSDLDFAVVGGGFTGLSAAAWLKRFEPEKTVALFESGLIGAGSSGHTGGMVLAETAAGDLPGLGDVLAGFSAILKDLAIECEHSLPGVYEIGRTAGLADSPFSWNDSGTLRAVNEVPGGMINPGKMVSGLARAAEQSGVRIFENTQISAVEYEDPLRLKFSGGGISAKKVLLATNAMSLELSDLERHGQPKFTIALATEPLGSEQLKQLGLASQKPFYTIDFPYLWGRLISNSKVIFGAGLVHMENWREVEELDISEGEAARLMTRLENRVHALHPAMQEVRITHRWGGPILIADGWLPTFAQHPQSANAIVLGGYSGHGVALSVYLGRWAAEVLCGRRLLPDWSRAAESA